ncbi:MAG: AGE family epimerase/isomerase [Burkholderiales bacterium]
MSPAIDPDPEHPGAALRRWLIEQALPTWAGIGVDRQAGGFFEAIDLQGHAVEAPRRTRVVARQVYVFATAARRGWWAGADALVEHGLAFMLQELRREDGSFASSVRADGTLVDARFDLYEQAFALFALAAARRDRPDRAALHDEATALLQALRDCWRHPLIGFEEAAPRSLPLRSNPHMHLLEAALEWAEVAEPRDRPLWNELADELVRLCLTHFIDRESGALREHFDGDWQPMPGAPGRVVEPGHQFEWGWLLLRWAARSGDAAALSAAHRLIAIGEAHGVDRSRGVAINTLDDALQVTDANAKLWPQTERIKAWHAALVRAPDALARMQARARLRDAVAGLTRYLLPSPAGLWHEVMNVRGDFVLQDCRASSLYHIVCAIDTLERDDA